jgi:hypothetical protein
MQRRGAAQRDAMTNAIILDVLLVLIVLLSMPLGFWRGVNREIFVAAAILLGMTLAATWNERWGGRVADWLSTGHAMGRFLAAMGLIGVSTLIIGYGGGALAARGARIGRWGRLTGAALAAATGVVLLALALRYTDQDLSGTYSLDVLHDGMISGFLIEHFTWILAALGGAAVLTVIVGAIVLVVFPPGADLPAVEAVPPPDRGDSLRDRRRPVRLPQDPEGGKFEPEGKLGAEAPSIAQSAPMGTIDPARWSADRTSPAWTPSPWRASLPAESSNGETGRRLGGREWIRREPLDEGPDVQGRRTRRCERCGQAIGSDDIYCPRCGRGMTS